MNIVKNSSWINKKNNKTYIVDGIARNCTNSNDGQIMIIYHLEREGTIYLGEPETTFVRSKDEFIEKFSNSNLGEQKYED